MASRCANPLNNQQIALRGALQGEGGGWCLRNVIVRHMYDTDPGWRGSCRRRLECNGYGIEIVRRTLSEGGNNRSVHGLDLVLSSLPVEKVSGEQHPGIASLRPCCRGYSRAVLDGVLKDDVVIRICDQTSGGDGRTGPSADARPVQCRNSSGDVIELSGNCGHVGRAS